jgi:hypothetical protein
MTKKLIKNVKDSMKLGIVSMAGMGAVGAMSGVPGMPNTTIPSTVGAGMQLANIGQVANIGMGLAGSIGTKKKGKIGCKYCDNILS